MKKEKDRPASVEKKLSALRVFDFFCGGLLLLIQAASYFMQRDSGVMTYETGRFVYGALGLVLLALGFLTIPKRGD